MNILIVANHYPVCSARYATAAFERLGHTVRHFGPDMGRDIWGLRVPQEYVWQSNGLDTIPGADELVIVMDSDPQLLDSWDKWNCTKVVWGVDNHVRNYYRPYYDHYFLAHRGVSQMAWTYPSSPLWTVGNILPEMVDDFPKIDMTHLPVAYDPNFTPSPIPWSERKYDVAVLGVMYPQRMAAVKALQAAGLSVIWGAGAIYETYRDLHHNSRIALNLSACGDVNQRIFEAAALGCVVMSDECKDFDILKPEGIWLIDDLNDIVEEVRFVLADPVHAQEMIDLSVAWVKPHTWDERANRIVEWYERKK